MICSKKLLATTKKPGFGKNRLKLVFVETETLLDYFRGGLVTTGSDLGRTGSLMDYMHSGPTGATYLPESQQLAGIRQAYLSLPGANPKGVLV